MESSYDNPINFTRMEDELFSNMLFNPDESMALHKFMEQIGKVVPDLVYNNKLPIKATYTIDLGHGLVAPVQHLTYLVAMPFERLVDWKGTKKLDLTIMVVDDEHPEEWYQRILSVGFKEISGQQGTFCDAETALKALEHGRYDVILTDIELGQGKMDGIEFVERAYEIQKRNGITPRISVFSFNKDKLDEAERRLRPNNGEEKVMHQINLNYKSGWTATHFKQEVLYSLKRENGN